MEQEKGSTSSRKGKHLNPAIVNMGADWINPELRIWINGRKVRSSAFRRSGEASVKPYLQLLVISHGFLMDMHPSPKRVEA